LHIQGKNDSNISKKDAPRKILLDECLFVLYVGYNPVNYLV